MRLFTQKLKNNTLILIRKIKPLIHKKKTEKKKQGAAGKRPLKKQPRLQFKKRYITIYHYVKTLFEAFGYKKKLTAEIKIKKERESGTRRKERDEACQRP